MSSIDQPQSFPGSRPPRRPFERVDFQKVEDLETAGWQVVSSTSVSSEDTDLLLEHAKAETPTTLFDGPVVAVGPDGRYYCMRKRKSGFSGFRKQADR